MKYFAKSWAPILTAAALAALAGCTEEKRAGFESPEGYPPTTEPRSWARTQPDMYEAKPAPAPAPKAQPMTGNVARMYFPTGEASSSTLLVEEFLPGQVRVGQPFDGQIKVTNISKQQALTVFVVTEAFKNWDVQSSTPPGNKTSKGYEWNLGDMNPGQVTTINIKGRATAVGAVGNCLSAIYNTSLCAQTNAVQPALAITKTITPESLLTCGPITTTIEVSNTGSGAADNVTITDNLPAGLTTADGKQTVTIAAGNLASGEKKSFPVALKATKTGKFDNMATATADGGLTASSQTVSTVVKQPVLTIECKSAASVIANRDANFDITVTNKGDAACDVTVTCPHPAGMTYVNATEGGTGTGTSAMWRVGNLAPGASKLVRVTYRSPAVGNIAISAQAACNCAAPVTTSCKTDVIGVPDIGTLLTDDNGVPSVGETHEFRYQVKNQGMIDLTNVVLKGTLSDGLEWVSSNSPVAAKVTGKSFEINIGTIKAGTIVSFNIVAKGIKAGDQNLKTQTSAKEIPFVAENQESVNYIEANPK